MTTPSKEEIIELARLFNKKAKNLEDEEFLKNLQLNIHTKEQEHGTHVFTSFDGPDRKTTESFLLRFRPFVIQGEAIHFLSVCNKLNLLLKDIDPELLKKVHDVKIAWQKVLAPGASMKFNIGEETIEAEEIFDLWLNGEFFHPTDTKEQKYKKLELAKIPPFEQMLYLQFIDYVQKYAILIRRLDLYVIQKII
jgi:hypothetical protein